MSEPTFKRLFLVRRTRFRSVVVHVEEGPGLGDNHSVRLLRITPDSGPLPEVSDIIGHVFPSRKVLRDVLIERLANLWEDKENEHAGQ